MNGLMMVALPVTSQGLMLALHLLPYDLVVLALQLASCSGLVAIFSSKPSPFLSYFAIEFL